MVPSTATARPRTAPSPVCGPNSATTPYDGFYLDWDSYYNNEPFYKPFRDQELLDRVNEALAVEAGQREEAETLAGLRERVGALTPREHEVFERVADGQANKVVAIDLGISDFLGWGIGPVRAARGSDSPRSGVCSTWALPLVTDTRV